MAAVASFAVGGACPLGLLLVCPALDNGPREQLLSAALGALDQAGPESFAPAEKELVVQLRRQHALLATLARIRSTAGTVLSNEQMAQVGQAAEGVQLAEGVEIAAAAATACLEQLLTAGCDALAVLSVAFELAGLGTAAQGQGKDASLALVQAAAKAAVATALAAMSSDAEPGSLATPLSAGDAIQNLYGVMRALDVPSAARHPAAAPAVGDLRLCVWRQLQAHVASSEAAGLGSSTTEAEARLQVCGVKRMSITRQSPLSIPSSPPLSRVQVLELLGSLGTSLWVGWWPPADRAAAQAAGGGFDHQRALLVARVVAALAAAGWPSAAQQCGLAAGDFSSVENAESAVLRLVDVADSTQQLQAVVTVLQQALAHAFCPAEGGGDKPEAGAHPLHRAWSACLHALLHQRELVPVLAALDEACAAARAHSAQHQQQQGSGGPPLLTLQEAQSLVEAADGSLGPTAAAMLSALLPYLPLHASAMRHLLETIGGSGASVPDPAALPGMPALLLALAAQRTQPLLPALASSNQRTFRQLASTLVAQEDASLWVDLGAGLTLRAAAVASLAAQLAAARHYTPAAWLAMQFSGLHPLLQVLDSSVSALRQLLRACSSAAPAGRAASAVVELPPALAAALGPARLAEDVLQNLPERCDAALQQLDLDLE